MKLKNPLALVFLFVILTLQSISVDARDREGAEFKPIPHYPRAAALECVQGEVVAKFTVTETYEPSDIEILESNPERIFDEAVLDVLKTWIVNAKPGSVIEERFDFKIDGCLLVHLL